MNNIYKTLLLFLALTFSVSAQTGDNTKIFYDFKDALWNQAATTAKDTGTPGGKNATVNGTNVTFVNNGTGGTAIQYSITTADAKLDGVTVDWGEKFVLEARIKKSALSEGGYNSEIHILKNVVTTGLDWYINTENKMVLKVGDGSSLNIVSDSPVIGEDTWITLAAVVDLSQATIEEAVKFFINEGEVSTGGESETTPALNQVVFDQEFTNHDFNTNPLVIDNLLGDSFDYTGVITYKANTTGSGANQLYLRPNSDSTSNFRTYYMYGHNTSKSGQASDSTSAEVAIASSTNTPVLVTFNISGETGSERFINATSSGFNTNTEIRKSSIYWKNTDHEITSLKFDSAWSVEANAHIRIYATPKAATTDNWEIIDTLSWNSEATEKSFSGLDGDIDKQYKLVWNGDVELNFELNNDSTSSSVKRQRLYNSSGTVGAANDMQSKVNMNGKISSAVINASTGSKRIIKVSSSRTSADHQTEEVHWYNDTSTNITSIACTPDASATGYVVLYKKKDPEGVADKYNLPFQKVAEVDINGDFSAGHVFDNLTGDSDFLYKVEFVGSGSVVNLHAQINGDTSSNYIRQRLRGDGSTSAASSATENHIECTYLSNAQNTFNMYLLPKSGKNRSMIIEGTRGTEDQIFKQASWWQNSSTDQITSIKVFGSNSNTITGKLILSAIPLDTSSQSSGGSQQQSGGSNGIYTAYAPTVFSYSNEYSSGDRSALISVSQTLPSGNGNVFTDVQNLVNGDESEDVGVPNTGDNDPLWGIEFDFDGKEIAFEEIQLLTSTSVSPNHVVQFYEGWNGSGWEKISNDFALSSTGITTTAINSPNYFTKLRFRGGNTGSATSWKEIKFNCSTKEEVERSKVLTSVDTSSSVVPTLTSNSDQGYTVTAGSVYSGTYQEFNAVDGTFNTNNGYVTGNNDPLTWWQITGFTSNVSALKILGGYSSTTTDHLKSFQIIDVESNKILKSVSNYQQGQVVTFYNEGISHGIKIQITENNGYTGFSSIGEIEFYSGTYTRGQPQKPFIIASSKIPQNEGTPVGDMTGNGGLVAAYNGSLHETYIAASSKGTLTDGTIGKDWGVGNEKTIGKLIMYGPNNQGFFNYHGNATYNFQISDDGTIWQTIHSVSEAHNNVGNLIKEIDLPSPVKSRFFRVHLSNTLDAYPYMSELELFEATAPDGSEYTPLENPIGYTSFGDPISNTGVNLTVSTGGYGGNHASHAIDGNEATWWETTQNTGWIRLEYPSVKKFNGLYLKQYHQPNYKTDSVNIYVDDVLKETINIEETGHYALAETYEGTSIKVETATATVTHWLLSNIYTTIGTPYYELPPASGGSFSVGQVALSSSSTYTTGVYPTISGENAIEMLTKTGDFSLESDFVKMTLKRTESAFDEANFQKSEGYKVDGNYNLTGTTASSIYIYPPKLLRRVNNPPTDFDNLGRPKDGVTVDIDNGAGGKVFYGVFQFEFALSQAISENVTVDVYMKTGDFDFKKVAEIKPTPKPANAEDPWIIRHYWNARASQFDWDGNAYKTTGAVQFKFEVR